MTGGSGLAPLVDLAGEKGLGADAVLSGALS